METKKQKIIKWLVMFAAWLAKLVVPGLCIKNWTKRCNEDGSENPYAKYFVPGYSSQIKAAKKFSDAEIDGREWSFEAMETILSWHNKEALLSRIGAEDVGLLDVVVRERCTPIVGEVFSLARPSKRYLKYVWKKMPHVINTLPVENYDCFSDFLLEDVPEKYRQHFITKVLTNSTNITVVKYWASQYLSYICGKKRKFETVTDEEAELFKTAFKRFIAQDGNLTSIIETVLVDDEMATALTEKAPESEHVVEYVKKVLPMLEDAQHLTAEQKQQWIDLACRSIDCVAEGLREILIKCAKPENEDADGFWRPVREKLFATFGSFAEIKMMYDKFVPAGTNSPELEKQLLFWVNMAYYDPQKAIAALELSERLSAETVEKLREIVVNMPMAYTKDLMKYYPFAGWTESQQMLALAKVTREELLSEKDIEGLDKLGLKPGCLEELYSIFIQKSGGDRLVMCYPFTKWPNAQQKKAIKKVAIAGLISAADIKKLVDPELRQVAIEGLEIHAELVAINSGDKLTMCKELYKDASGQSVLSPAPIDSKFHPESEQELFKQAIAKGRFDVAEMYIQRHQMDDESFHYLVNLDLSDKGERDKVEGLLRLYAKEYWLNESNYLDLAQSERYAYLAPALKKYLNTKSGENRDDASVVDRTT